MAAGAIAVPTIIPLRAPIPGQHKTMIDSNTKIELRSETPGTTIYYTTSGQNPEPFQKHSPAAKATMKYHSPFRLPGGRRSVKAVAIAEDGLRESFVVTKAFDVEQLAQEYSDLEDDGTRFIHDIPHSTSSAKREMARAAGKMMTSKAAWEEVQKSKHIEAMYNGINATNTKVGAGPRFMNNRLGTDRSGISGGRVGVDPIHGTSSTEVDLHYRNKKMPDNGTQAMRLQRETDFLKCVYCFASRPSDPYARFCNECGNPVQQLPTTRIAPPEAGQMGICVHCNSQVPFNTTSCLICEAPIPAQNQPMATVKLANKLVCTICGTGNPANLATCIACEAKLPLTGAPLLNTSGFAPNRAREENGRLLTCTKCGRVNHSDARFCDWCGTKPSPLISNLSCDKCHASNNPYARFCCACGETIDAPKRPEVVSNGFSVTQSKTSGNAQWMPIAVRNPAPKYDISTQTVGLFYPSNKGMEQNREKEDERLNLERDMRDKKPVLTAISPGKGYWRKQIDHICAHVKAHAQNNAEFRALVGEPRMGKVISSAVHEDGYELSLTINFALRGNKDPFVGERMGYSKRELLSNMTRKASLNSYGGSQDSLVSGRSTARSRGGFRKKTVRKQPKKKPARENPLTEEDKMLLKEIGKNGEGDAHEVEKLIEEGADPNLTNKDDVPLLHIAVLNKRHEAIPVLVQNGVDVNVKGPNKGNTALHEAVALGFRGSETVDALLGCRANINRKNDKGETAYDMAVKSGETEIANKLGSSVGQNKLDKLMKTSGTTRFDDSF